MQTKFITIKSSFSLNKSNKKINEQKNIIKLINHKKNSKKVLIIIILIIITI